MQIPTYPLATSAPRNIVTVSVQEYQIFIKYLHKAMNFGMVVTIALTALSKCCNRVTETLRHSAT